MLNFRKSVDENGLKRRTLSLYRLSYWRCDPLGGIRTPDLQNRCSPFEHSTLKDLKKVLTKVTEMF